MKMRQLFPAIIITAILVVFGRLAPAAEPSPRERLSLDSGWKFHLGDDWPQALKLDKAGSSSGPAAVKFQDDSWRTVNLPHDWVVELPFDQRADGSHGFHPVGPGFPQNSIAWYRRSFDLPKADAGKRLWLEFDGAYRDCTVFVNGWIIGHHESGYSSFRYDISDVAHAGGSNVVAVKVDASQFEGWFYEGAGIYRHTWLVKTSPLAIAPDGLFVYGSFSNNVPQGPAAIHLETRLLNSSDDSASAVIKYDIISPTSESVAQASFTATVKPWSEAEVIPTTLPQIISPILWSPESPKLYKIIITVESGGQIVDRQKTEFGLRTFGFDPEQGFVLNGQHYEIKGTCNHQDHAGVGSALPDAIQNFRISKLKEMGDNAYRTSHNPPTPELLDACDHLGMLVLDENRLLGSDAQNLVGWENQIRRDRNHASVAMWSIANEEFYTQNTTSGARVAKTMQNLVQKMDPTRPVTYAAPVGDVFTNSINSVIQVRGWNYHVGGDMDKYHAEHPDQPNVGTEQASTVCTRGIYANDKGLGYVSAYDENAPPWAHRAEVWWSFFAARPWLSGGFAWTGFDYRGEPTPYDWPCINSHFGILDTCGFPKDNFYYYQAWWTDNTVLHLLPHWNWPGKAGQEIDVRCFSNCEAVELYLNGISQGKQTVKTNSHLAWKVKYAPGVLSAKGYTAGKVIAETKVETTGEPAAVQLTPDRATLAADGQDASLITVSVADAQGRVVPVAGNLIHFTLSGPGKILGVGNGDPSSHEPDQYIPQSPVRSVALSDWVWKSVAKARTNLAEVQLEEDDSHWQKAKTEGSDTLLSEGQSAVFRTHVSLTEADLSSPLIHVRLGSIDDQGWVYVNGQLVGESDDWATSPSFSIKKYLHTGDNVLAVAVYNEQGGGGLNKGVYLDYQSEPVIPAWQRSVFNGLAQIIVQTSKEPGEIILTATADGLAPVSTTLKAQSCSPRPSIP